MDKALKLLVGVVVISGLIAFILPSDSPVEPPQPVEVAPPPPATNTAVDTPAAPPIEVTSLDTPDVQFGQPTITGLPFGAEAAPAVNADAPKPEAEAAPPPSVPAPEPQPDVVSADSSAT